MNPLPDLRRLPRALAALLCFGVAGYALVGYGFWPPGALVDGAMRASFEAHPVGLLSHVFAASVALLLGPLQFSARLRQGRPGLHRGLGRLYLGIGVGLGGLSGLYMAQFASGGAVARLGFGTLAIAWLFTGLQAWRAIRRGAVARHRAWMQRNMALTLAAVTLRLGLPLALVAGVPFEPAYAAIAWLCWLPNLALAEWMIRRRHFQATAAAPGPASGITSVRANPTSFAQPSKSAPL